jgi:hypothetical protein
MAGKQDGGVSFLHAGDIGTLGGLGKHAGFWVDAPRSVLDGAK